MHIKICSLWNRDTASFNIKLYTKGMRSIKIVAIYVIFDPNKIIY